MLFSCFAKLHAYRNLTFAGYIVSLKTLCYLRVLHVGALFLAVQIMYAFLDTVVISIPFVATFGQRLLVCVTGVECSTVEMTG